MDRIKKVLIDKAMRSGTIDRVARLMSASYILNSVSNNLLQESGEELRKEGLMLGELGSLHKMFLRSADRYCQAFADMVGRDNAKVRQVFGDMEEFEKGFRHWAKLDGKEADNEAE